MDKRREETSIEASSSRRQLNSLPPSRQQEQTKEATLKNDKNNQPSKESTATTIERNGSKNTISSFDHDLTKYKCCCSLLHVRHGVQIIGFIEILCAFLSLIRYLFTSTEDRYKWFLIAECIYFAFLVLIVICLYLAIHKMNPFLLIPYLIYESLALVESFSFIVFSIMAISDPDGIMGDWYYSTVEETSNFFKDVERHTLINYIAIATILFYVISIIIQFWFNYVVFKCFIYLRAYQKFRSI
uniref:MARVEL domain-containing protein n=1 Tax=Panagrolaimus davidi TaxID=227884 RepID=A0A914QJU8_9BILA